MSSLTKYGLLLFEESGDYLEQAKEESLVLTVDGDRIILAEAVIEEPEPPSGVIIFRRRIEERHDT